jgi:hypothetical protein
MVIIWEIIVSLEFTLEPNLSLRILLDVIWRLTVSLEVCESWLCDWNLMLELCHWKLLLSLKLYCGLSGKLLCHWKSIMDWKLLWKEILGLKWHWKLLLDFKFPWYVFGIRWWKIIWYCGHAIPINTRQLGWPALCLSTTVYEPTIDNSI